MKHLSLFFLVLLFVSGCGKDEDDTACRTRLDIVGRWAVTAVTDIAYDDDRDVRDRPTEDFTAVFSEDGTGYQRFANGRPGRELRYFLPQSICDINLTTIFREERTETFFTQTEGSADRQVWQVETDLFDVSNPDDNDEPVGSSTLTWTLVRLPDPATDFVCPERRDLTGTWSVSSFTDFEYFDDRTPPEGAFVEFEVEIFVNNTGIQRFTGTNLPSRQLEFSLPPDFCDTRMTTISLSSRIMDTYVQLEASNNRRVWQTVIELYIAGSIDPDDLIGYQTITWTMERQ